MTDWLICGLGNPGAKYRLTPHNVGFMTADKIADEYNAGFSKKFQAEIATVRRFAGVSSSKVYLVKPQSFMNLSGSPLKQVAAYYKITPQNIIVVHDDIDLSFGRIKLKIGGGSGGHNGIKSIDQNFGTGDYYRVRIGVGRGTGAGDAASHVLSAFNGNALSELDGIIDQAVLAAGLIITDGLERAQMSVH